MARQSPTLQDSALLVMDVQDSFRALPRWERRSNPGFEANLTRLIDAYRTAELAARAGMSVRNLTRQFRAAAGIGIHDYLTRLKLERARNLMRDPALTLEAVAERSGLGEARRLWRSGKRPRQGGNPVETRQIAPGAPAH
jgi:transcriptional regulator GlxA family with amidase domain